LDSTVIGFYSAQLSLSLVIGFPIISIHGFYSSHYLFDEMTLSGICYFSLINGSLHFKQWDSGTNKAPNVGLPITILTSCLEDKTIIETVGDEFMSLMILSMFVSLKTAMNALQFSYHISMVNL
jgi:hypothetical protein